MPALFGRTPLVGRARELANVSEGLDAVRRGEGAVLLLAGEPGIGKTRLAEELAARAQQRGLRVLWGRCYEGEGAPAFWPWTQILRVALQDPALDPLLPALGITALLTEAIAAIGDASAAATLYRRLAPYTGHYIVNAAAPNFYGAADHYLGMLAATMSRWDDAILHFESALAMNTRTSVPSHIVSTQVEYARALLNAERGTRDADTRKAHEYLDAALASARELGMSRTRDQIEQLQQMRRPTKQGLSAAMNAGLPAGLTPRETEVLGLLASGLSNQKLAEALVVTVNTVERHLVSIYGKLGVKGRAAATAYAHRHGLVR